MTEIKRLLIANRGEIACRIIESCRNLGITSIAVYSDADRKARHVRMADVAVYLGPSDPAESYLNITKVVNAAQMARADAVHPGYGFLSENTDFAEQLQQAGLIFIGPKSSVIESMAEKDRAKAIMEQAGVPVVPGWSGDSSDDQQLADAAAQVGYPILLKAIAGGGGRGMRVVNNAEQFNAALHSSRREAKQAFGNDSMIIERFVEQARHIEVQIFGDQHGHYVHLFERECSVQRRHQKVIEEAPSPTLNPEQREQICAAAVRAAEAVEYSGAGTVEFLLTPRGEFFFMEMNTRLQVEHPVTELITGLDLVEWQIRVAAGQALPQLQDQISCSGHAIECRIYAEDPDNDYRPSTGKVLEWSYPDDVRVDTGIESGDEISSFYDPMIAKISTWHEAREPARNAMVRALHQLTLHGPRSNIEHLLSITRHSEFQQNHIHTRWLDELKLHPVSMSLMDLAMASIFTLDQSHSTAPWQDRHGWTVGNRYRELPFQWMQADGKVWTVTLQYQGEAWRVQGLAQSMDFIIIDRGSNDYHVECMGFTQRWQVHQIGPKIQLTRQGHSLQFNQVEYDLSESAQTEVNSIVSELPGRIQAVHCKTADQVKKGDLLISMEAMKMEMNLLAPASGCVAEVLVKTGEQVSADQLLVVIDV